MGGLTYVGAGGSGARRPGGFWRRQFGGAATPAQRRFDVAFGLVLPVACFACDPLVFRSWILGEGLLERFQFYAYTVSGLEMVALGVWLFGPREAPRPQSALAGMLLAGAAFSFAVGLLIMPFSLLGLIYVVGALGFVPFLTGFAYLRNGVRAAALGRAGEGARAADLAALGLSFGFALGAPAATQLLAARAAAAAVEDVRAGRELSPARARALRAMAPAAGPAAYDGLLTGHDLAPNEAGRRRMAGTYLELTGVEMQRRRARLND